MAALREKVSELERAAAQRKAKLDENSAFLQFNWKADVVESWIGTGTFTLPVQHHTFCGGNLCISSGHSSTHEDHKLFHLSAEEKNITVGSQDYETVQDYLFSNIK